MRIKVPLLLIIVLFFPSALFGAAGCFLWKDHSILMVRDVWTKRWSLPGGHSEPGETPEETALRELEEETGIKAKVLGGGTPLANSFLVFACEPLQPIVGFASPAGFRVRLPKSALVEVLEARFIDIEKKKAGTFRFPRQREDLYLMLSRFSSAYGEAKFEYREYLYQAGDSPMSLDFVKKVQATFPGKFWNFFFRVFSFLGEEQFFFLVLPFLFVYWSRDKSLALALLIICSATVSSITKNYFGVYRPFDLLASVEVGKAFDFSFPSGHAIITAAGWMFWAGTHGFHWRVVSLLVVLLACLSRVHLGVHFLEDVLAGAAIGTTMALLALHWIRHPPRRLKGRGLHVIGIALLSACFAHFSPATWLAFSAFCGLFAVMNSERTVKVPLPPWAIAVSGVIGFMILSKLFGWLVNFCEDFWACAVMSFFKYFSLGAWLGLLGIVRRKR